MNPELKNGNKSFPIFEFGLFWTQIRLQNQGKVKINGTNKMIKT
jgi:hypothetical protein